MVAYYTILERRILGSIHRRKGPLSVGFIGLLQAIADGLKLLCKEGIKPTNSDKLLYLLCPVFTFILSLISWAVIPLGIGLCYIEIKFNLLFLLAVSGLNVYGVILSGWASNSKYALLGALRAGAQMISYEISFSIILLNIIISTGSINLLSIIAAQSYSWYCFQHFPIFIMFLVTILAETNRHPYDFAEAESELVSGFNVEYSSMHFTFFFLAEYSNMILMSVLTCLLFLGGWSIPFLTHKVPFFLFPVIVSFKTLPIMVFIINSRATLPRSRYDLLMNLGWKTFLPLNLAWFIMTIFLLLSFEGLPAIQGYSSFFCYFNPEFLFICDYKK
jgi:NADH-quinone oxidoreductase subunit H